MAKLFKTAFAYQGIKEQLPDAAQPDGKASFAEGFTDDYTLDYNDGDARDIAQSELNGIFHDITEAIGELQKYGVAVWQSNMSPIAKYSLVFHDGKLWQAKANTSTQPVQGANWQQVDIAGVVQTSGQSTTKVMSQKAVTDAISDAASGQLSWGAITGDIDNQTDLQNALKSMRWGTISGNVTLTDADNGKTFLITNNAVITVDDGLSAGWNVAFVPDDSKDSTAYDATLAFVGSGSVIGNNTTIKGASSLALTPIADLFATAGAIE